jgi:hypothetical protein
MRAGTATGLNAFQTALDDRTMIGPWNASRHHPAKADAGRWKEDMQNLVVIIHYSQASPSCRYRSHFHVIA